MICFKIHIKQRKRILAACDEGLLGKKLSEGKIVMDLKKHRGFYEGEKTDGAGLVEEIKKRGIDSYNFVGKESVAAGVKAKVMEEGCEQMVAGVPHVQVYRI
ncbi:Uncharacterised protein [Candidatus Gugararchaeum adminiculabundum]|nr:Uncharacterised protein [Candidatus Gugararchaeum adminiculabundum]